MNINLTKKQIESLTFTWNRCFIIEQWPRFQILSKSIPKIDVFTDDEWEHINALPVKSKNFPIDLVDLNIKKIEYFKKNYPDKNCKLFWYADILHLFFAYNYYKKNGYDCLPMWDNEYINNEYDSGAVLLLKNK